MSDLPVEKNEELEMVIDGLDFGDLSNECIAFIPDDGSSFLYASGITHRDIALLAASSQKQEYNGKNTQKTINFHFH